MNDSDHPFRKLQAAIDAASAALTPILTSSNPPANMLATVICMEGVYGPLGQVTPTGTTCGGYVTNHNGSFASGDILPIVMRDRVHVRGVGARRCILRGVRCGDVNTSGNQPVFWPSAITVDGNQWERSPTSEVLLDLSNVSVVNAPWFAQLGMSSDMMEVFEGFTFQSGDVQVICRSGYDLDKIGEPKAIVANCIFDMRHNFLIPGQSQPVFGPTFGVLMEQAFVPFHTYGGYVDIKLLVAQNTFVFTRYTESGGQPVFVETCFENAVGVMNVNDPCFHGLSGGVIDCDRTLYGMANCGVVGNIFRTPAYPLSPLLVANARAMIGIDASDTIATGSGAAAVESNAYANIAVGTDNQAGSGFTAHLPWSPPQFTNFSSIPVATSIFAGPGVPLYYPCSTSNPGLPAGSTCATPPPGNCCTAVPIATPTHSTGGISLFHITQLSPSGFGDDPRFVGEFLSTRFPSAFPTPCIDWRLLPGSTCINSSISLDSARTVFTQNGGAWDLKTIRDVDPYQWDGEHYGNRRISLAKADAGFDESMWLITAGSYSNYSNSHNVAGSLNPSVPDSQVANRYFIMPKQISVQGAQFNLVTGDQINIYRTAQPFSLPLPPSSWSQPPATKVPAELGGAPLLPGFRTKYINFTPGSAFNFSYVAGAPPTGNDYSYVPLHVLAIGLPSNSFALFTQTDNECATPPCAHEWFNTQCSVFRDPDELVWSNLQHDYR